MKKIYFLCVSIFLFISVKELTSQTGWFAQNSGTTQNLIKVRFANVNTGWIISNDGQILCTTNGGLNWITQFNSDTSFFYSLFVINPDTVWVTTWGSNVTLLKTINGGINWTSLIIGDNILLVSIFFINPNLGWILTDDGQIFKTTNGGTNWVHLNQPYSEYFYNTIFFTNINNGYYTGGDAMTFGQIKKTTDGGITWYDQYVSYTTNKISNIFFINQNRGWALPGGGNILSTTDAGSNWIIQNGSSVQNLLSVYFINEDTGWISSSSGFIFKTTNSGANWNSQNITTQNLNDIWFVDQNTGWVTGYHGTILKTTTGGDPIGIKPISSDIPSYFSLSQNYPNPFNPSTKIKFEIEEDKGQKLEVRLVVYDILGREIATLVNDKLSPGTYEVKWNGSDYASGVYFYKLISGDYTETKKLILLK